MGFHVIPSKANFVFCYHDAIDSGELCDRQEENPHASFADERLTKYLRITIRTEQEMEVVEIAIREILKEAVGEESIDMRLYECVGA